MLDGAGEGALWRRDGKLVSLPFGKGKRSVRFADRERTVLPIPWGDLESGYRSTGIPNITTYMALPRAVADAAAATWPFAAAAAPVLKSVLGVPSVRGALGKLISARVSGPGESARKQGKAYVWARASDAHGRATEAWLVTPDAYAFTAIAGVRSVEHILAHQPRGALTPSTAFGEDFVLEIEGVTRLDTLPAR
jgi:short subunit dehydrogenase-like uncharacterized protein